MSKTSSTGMKPVEALTGTVKGKRFTVVLDDIKLGDKWDSAILSVLQRDGIGSPSVSSEGDVMFAFANRVKSTIKFSADSGNIIVNEFFVIDDGKEEA